jgi:hypothetical protein
MSDNHDNFIDEWLTETVFQVDMNIADAVEAWHDHGLPPGSCTELLLRGRYDEARKHAHPLILPHWDDHVKWIETIPVVCRGANFDNWRGKHNGGLMTFTADDDDFTI